MSSKLVGHVNAGIIWSYGNSDDAPFSEMFYAGGANSIRAFSVRDIGPGRFNDFDMRDRQFNYIFRNGETKLIANLEYRMPLFGNLHGAVFLDAGNVWNLKGSGITDDDIKGMEPEDALAMMIIKEWGDQSKFEVRHFLNDLALGTGIGLRYDLGFLVVRVDWGYALHCPQDTGKSGYFNAPRFKHAQTLNFAIGYPF